ncbi:FAD-dependent oxidoreductase [Bradyrhizobium cenepequi]
MAATNADYLIVGGGAAAVTAAATLRLQNTSASVMILSAEDWPPYYRPALSKQFLLGRSSGPQILIHPESFYREQRIELALGHQAVSLDPGTQTLTTSTGQQIRYEHLLIATGSHPKRLSIAGATLPGVHHLRGMAECETVRREITAGAKHAVVLGASFLGMEIAMSLIDLGLNVTIIECRDLVLPHLESANLSIHFKCHVEQRGATVLMSETIAAIRGIDRVAEVETASGATLPCDLLMVSVGVTPATEFLTKSGIELDRGLVIVDDQLRTNAPNVFAAGDVTSFQDPVFAQRRHIEHWDNAIKQGRLAALNMLGHRMRYDEVSYFFCDIGDISFSMLGAPEQAREHVARGSLAEKSFALIYLADDVPRACFSVGRPVEETRSIEGLIRYRVNIGNMKSKLDDPDFSLDAIPTQTVFVLQGGGALGAFECGVVKALEEDGIFPDIVAGISIGALNGAIVAGNPHHATAALESFWSELAVASPTMWGTDAATAITSMEILMFGVPNFFRPRWMPSFSGPVTMPVNWTSFYDVAPMRELIARYVDFPSLKASPVRLLFGAVNVASGELEVFDSYTDDLTPDHVLASGSLPPGFPSTEIAGKAYWDGGLVSNSPLEIVIERCGPGGKRVFIVDLFAGERPLPTNIIEVMARRDEIVYSERIRSDLRLRELVAAYRGLIDGICNLVDPTTREKVRQRPLYIELMGDGATTSVTRFVRKGRPGEPSSRDYDFSDTAICYNQQLGYTLVKETLARAGEPTPNVVTPPLHSLLPCGSLPSIAESDRLAGNGLSQNAPRETHPIRKLV